MVQSQRLYSLFLASFHTHIVHNVLTEEPAKEVLRSSIENIFLDELNYLTIKAAGASCVDSERVERYPKSNRPFLDRESDKCECEDRLHLRTSIHRSEGKRKRMIEVSLFERHLLDKRVRTRRLCQQVDWTSERGWLRGVIMSLCAYQRLHSTQGTW